MKNIVTISAFLFTFAFSGSILKSSTSCKLKYDSLSCLQIEGKITNSEDGEDALCKIELICMNDVVDTVLLKEGKKKFKFVLSKNSQYAIRISKKGYISKLISVNTDIVTEMDGIHKFYFETSLIKEAALKRLNRDVIDFPVAIIHFDYESNCFSYNKEYTENIKKEMRRCTPSKSNSNKGTENEILAYTN